MKTLLVAGVASLAVAAVLLVLGVVELSYPFWRGTLSVYPAGFFALVGIGLVYRSLKKLA